MGKGILKYENILSLKGTAEIWKYSLNPRIDAKAIWDLPKIFIIWLFLIVFSSRTHYFYYNV